jgi:hypothetical protein
MRSEVFKRFFDNLSAGDPLALTVAGVLVGFLVLVAVLWVVYFLKLRGEERARRRKFLGLSPHKKRLKSRRGSTQRKEHGIQP